MCKAVMQNFITEYEPKEDYIAVRMTNDCMKSSGIFTGSVMVVKLQRKAEYGDIVLFVRKGKKGLESYLRRVTLMGKYKLLVADDPAYETTTFTEDDYVIGKVVAFKTYFEEIA